MARLSWCFGRYMKGVRFNIRVDLMFRRRSMFAECHLSPAGWLHSDSNPSFYYCDSMGKMLYNAYV